MDVSKKTIRKQADGVKNDVPRPSIGFFLDTRTSVLTNAPIRAFQLCGHSGAFVNPSLPAFYYTTVYAQFGSDRLYAFYPSAIWPEDRKNINNKHTVTRTPYPLGSHMHTISVCAKRNRG